MGNKIYSLSSGILAKRFNVTSQTIRNARKGITNSDLAKEIRKASEELYEEMANNMEEKKIKMTQYGSVGKLAKLFGVTIQHVNRALKCEGNSNKCRAIRKYALENGGVEY